MSKKKLIIILVIVGAVSIIISLIFFGVIKFPTMEDVNNEGKAASIVSSIDELKDDRFYAWHESNAEETTEVTYQICPAGTINWKDNANVNHTVWFSSANDNEIPTVYPGDQLLYISATKVPHDGIKWERFADYGYTIGIANMVGDNSGHYYIALDAEDGYEGYVNPKSDAYALNQFDFVSELFLDKLGSVQVRQKHISDGGTVAGLEKNTKYLCEWYSGTYYQDFEMVADSHTFCSLESFTTYEYEFLHSRCISVTIPEWLKSGYYYVNGIGMFRYVSEKDQTTYNGEAYDKNIDWNDPIILYDERGSVIYDPSSNRVNTEEDVNNNPENEKVSGTLVNDSSNLSDNEKSSEQTYDPFTQEVIDASDSGVEDDEIPDEKVVE